MTLHGTVLLNMEPDSNNRAIDCLIPEINPQSKINSEKQSSLGICCVSISKNPKKAAPAQEKARRL